jgi:hypothetical protein
MLRDGAVFYDGERDTQMVRHHVGVERVIA